MIDLLQGDQAYLQGLVAKLQDQLLPRKINQKLEQARSEEATKEVLADLISSAVAKDLQQVGCILAAHLGQHYQQVGSSFKHVISRVGASESGQTTIYKQQPLPEPIQKAIPKCSKGFFSSRILPMFSRKAKEEGNFTPMILPQNQQKYHFDKELGRYVFQGETIDQVPQIPPPPKRKQTRDSKPVSFGMASELQAMLVPLPLNRRRTNKSRLEVPSTIQTAGVEVEQTAERIALQLQSGIVQTFTKVRGLLRDYQENKQQYRLLGEVMETMKEGYEMVVSTAHWWHVPNKVSVVVSNTAGQSLYNSKLSQLKTQLKELKARAKQLEIESKEMTAQLEEFQPYKWKFEEASLEMSRLRGDITFKQDQLAQMTACKSELSRLKGQLQYRDRLLSQSRSDYQACTSRVQDLLRNSLSPDQLSPSDIGHQGEVDIADPAATFLVGSVQLVPMIDLFAGTMMASIQGLRHDNNNLALQLSRTDVDLQSWKTRSQGIQAQLRTVILKQKSTLQTLNIGSNSTIQKLQSKVKQMTCVLEQAHMLRKEAKSYELQIVYLKGIIEQSHLKSTALSQVSKNQKMKSRLLQENFRVATQDILNLQRANCQLDQTVLELINGHADTKRLRDELISQQNRHAQTQRVFSETSEANSKDVQRLNRMLLETRDQVSELTKAKETLQVQNSQMLGQAYQHSLLVQSLEDEVRSRGLSLQQSKIVLQGFQKQVQLSIRSLADKEQQEDDLKTQLAQVSCALQTCRNQFNQQSGTICNKENQIRRLNETLQLQTSQFELVAGELLRQQLAAGQLQATINQLKCQQKRIEQHQQTVQTLKKEVIHLQLAIQTTNQSYRTELEKAHLYAQQQESLVQELQNRVESAQHQHLLVLLQLYLKDQLKPRLRQCAPQDSNHHKEVQAGAMALLSEAYSQTDNTRCVQANTRQDFSSWQPHLKDELQGGQARHQQMELVKLQEQIECLLGQIQVLKMKESLLQESNSALNNELAQEQSNKCRLAQEFKAQSVVNSQLRMMVRRLCEPNADHVEFNNNGAHDPDVFGLEVLSQQGISGEETGIYLLPEIKQICTQRANSQGVIPMLLKHANNYQFATDVNIGTDLEILKLPQPLVPPAESPNPEPYSGQSLTPPPAPAQKSSLMSLLTSMFLTTREQGELS